MARHLALLGWESVMIGLPEGLRTPEDDACFVETLDVEERGSSAQDAARVLSMCEKYGTQIVVMDDYRVDPEYQAILRGAGVRWLQQFDASAPWEFQPDLLVNASPYETRAQYLPWLKDADQTQTLFGPAYAVLRPQFRTVEARADGRAVRRIFVAFGGGDDRGALNSCITALAGRLGEGVKLVVVSGKGNPRNDENLKLVDGYAPELIEYHIGATDMAGLMQGCDLAVIGGGTMSYEAAICGLPQVFIGLSPNQERPCQGWVDRAGARYLGTVHTATGAQVFQTVSELVQDDEGRAEMARKGRALVDGKGVERLTAALLEFSET